MPASATSKIRDSCNSCAASKVRCPKEKPACSRCKSKNIACQYFATKRPGRKPDSKHAAKGKEVWDSVRATSAVPSAASISGASIDNMSVSPPGLDSFSPGSTNVIGDAEFDSSMDIFTEFLGPLNEPFSSPTMSGPSNDFNHLFTPPLHLLGLAGLDDNGPNNPQVHENLNPKSLLTPDDNFTDPFGGELSRILSQPSQPKPSSPNAVGQLPSPGSLTGGDISRPPASMCFCMAQALDLMKRLSQSSNETSSQSFTATTQGSGFATPSSKPHRSIVLTEMIITENRQWMEDVSKALDCSCAAENPYLLTVLSTILFKILDRYAAAVCHQAKGPGSHGLDSGQNSNQKKGFIAEHMPTVGSSVGLPNDESIRRITAQLVLSELHRVQVLLNRLSPKLNGKGAGDDLEIMRKSGSDPSSFSGAIPDDSKTSTPFLGNILVQTEAGLRRCLLGLSSDIINTLRRT